MRYRKVYEHTDGSGLYLGCVYDDGDMIKAENRECRLFYPFRTVSDGELFLRQRFRHGKWTATS